jgi:hypothetical protein
MDVRSVIKKAFSFTVAETGLGMIWSNRCFASGDAGLDLSHAESETTTTKKSKSLTGWVRGELDIFLIF